MKPAKKAMARHRTVAGTRLTVKTLQQFRPAPILEGNHKETRVRKVRRGLLWLRPFAYLLKFYSCNYDKEKAVDAVGGRGLFSKVGVAKSSWQVWSKNNWWVWSIGELACQPRP